MTIFLTGGNGMVGRNVRELAEQRRIEVLAPSSRELNLLDYAATVDWLKRIRPEIIVHAAGKVGGIHTNMAHPVDFLVENWDIGRNVVLAAREAGVKKLINLGSSCMYPRGHETPLKEEQLLSGELEPTNEGYALAKCAVERLCDYVRRETPEFQFKTLIPCNLYGRYDHFEPERSHLVPAIIHKVHEAKLAGAPSVEIWGDGTARREFLWAGDLADAILEGTARFDSMPAVMNVGVGRDFSVNEYYDAVARAVGYEGGFTHDLSRPVGMRRKLVDTGKADGWGWKARTSLEDGLAKTYEFYLQSGKA